MYKTILNLPILFIAFLTCCTNSAHKELCGTYIRNIDSDLLYSKFIIYQENKYSFYSSSCLSSNKDSGSYVFKEDTLYFTSFDTERDKLVSNTKSNKTLSGEKFVLKNNKLIYYRTDIYPTSNKMKNEIYADTLILRDTLYWIKDIVRKETTRTNTFL